MQKLKGEMKNYEMKNYESGDPEEGCVKVILVIDIPAKRLIGYMAGPGRGVWKRCTWSRDDQPYFQRL